MPSRQPHPETRSPDVLTERQRQVLELMARGHTNGEIGAKLGISLDGAKWHVSEIIGKLGVASRDEAAEWWIASRRPRARLTRAMHGLIAATWLRWAAVGLGSAAVATGIVGAIALQGGDTTTPAEGATPTLSPEPEPGEPAPSPRLIDPGDPIPAVTGTSVLLLDAATGGAELWDFGEVKGGFVRSDDRSYRYVSYGQGALWLLDTETGSVRALEHEGQRLSPVAVSGETNQLVGQFGSRATVFMADSLTPVAELAERPADWTSSSANAEWSPNGDAVAVLRQFDNEAMVDIVVGASAFSVESPAGARAIEWSRTGNRLAISGADATVVVDRSGELIVTIPAGGANPRWSLDDRYLAIAHPDNFDVVRVFDSRSGDEVLRVSGPPVCLGDYWHPLGGVASSLAVPASVVMVPQGTIIVASDDGHPEGSVAVRRSRGMVELYDPATGTIVASVDDAGHSLTSPSDQDGIYNLTSDGRGVHMIGANGRGFCDAGAPEPGVELPPFADNAWHP